MDFADEEVWVHEGVFKTSENILFCLVNYGTHVMGIARDLYQNKDKVKWFEAIWNMPFRT